MDPRQGNQFGLAFVRLPVAEPQRRARLEEVRARMATVKATHEAVIVYGALAVMGHTPTQLEQAWLDLFPRRQVDVSRRDAQTCVRRCEASDHSGPGGSTMLSSR